MEFKLQKEPQDEGGAEKTQILDTRGQQVLAMGDGPPSTVEETPQSHTPWTQGFSKINLQDSLVHKIVPKSAVHIFKNLPSSKFISVLMFFIMLGGGGGFVLWDYYVNDVDPMTHADLLLSLIPGLTVEITDNNQGVGNPDAASQRPGLQPANPDNSPSALNPSQEKVNIIKSPKGEGLNPYWGLSNDLAIPEGSQIVRRKITPEEEVSWANALKHKYPYQRYRAILEIRQARLAGSESLLWFALYDEKLWIRMRAIMTLAEFDIKVGLGHVKLAIGKEPDLRVANFFKRFVKHASPGDLYVMRHAIRLLSEQGRLVILQALERNRDEYRDMYMAAASLDKGPHIKKWLKQNYIIFDMNGANYQKYIAAITGSDAVAKDILKSPRLDGFNRQNNTGAPDAAKVLPEEPVTIPESATEIAPVVEEQPLNEQVSSVPEPATVEASPDSSGEDLPVEPAPEAAPAEEMNDF